jgi:hypothetical protein
MDDLFDSIAELERVEHHRDSLHLLRAHAAYLSFHS